MLFRSGSILLDSVLSLELVEFFCTTLALEEPSAPFACESFALELVVDESAADVIDCQVGQKSCFHWRRSFFSYLF